MTFRFRVYGQPASWNAAFRRGKLGSVAMFKEERAAVWQARVEQVCAKARPVDWAKTTPQLRIRYWMRLTHAMDADNVLKLVNDGIARGLGTRVKKMKLVPIVDDACFLPCVEELSFGHEEPHVEIEIGPHPA